MDLENKNVDALDEKYDFKENIIKCYNSESYRKLKAHFNKNDLFKVLGISRLESVHSKFIKWLLDPKEITHGLGDYPLKKFLQMTAIVKEKYKINDNAELPDKYLNKFILENFDIDFDEIAINTEVPIGEYGRLDIEIKDFYIVIKKDENEDKNKTAPFYIMIENKVKSKENKKQSKDDKDQTEKYYEWVKKQVKNKKYIPICIFLYPGNRRLECSSEYFLKVTYNDLSEYVIEPCLEKIEIDFGKMFIKEYLNTLSYSNVYNEGDIIMAISKQEKELCKEFYNEHHDLITYVLDAIENEDDIDDESLKNIKNKVDALKSSRDYTKYYLDGNQYNKSRLALAIIKKAASEYKSYNGLNKAMDNYFDKNSAILTNNYEQSKADQKKGNKRYFVQPEDMIVLDNKNYYVTNQWSKDEKFDDLLEIAKNKLKYTIEEAPNN